MKIKNHEGIREKKILTAMIVDTSVLSRISTKWPKGGLFSSKWANIVGSWCIKFYLKYGKPPKKGIESLFATWSENNHDEESTRLMERFLSSLSSEYKEEVNSDYILDIAGEYFNKIRLNKLAQALQEAIDANDLTKAEKYVDEHSRVELGVGAGINLFQDKEVIRAAFSKINKPIIHYPGALGEFFEGVLERDAFLAFIAPEKTGKTFWLIDIAWRAMLQRRKVAFFEVGDMSEHQIIKRFMRRASRKPKKPGVVKYPISIELPKEDQITPNVAWIDKKYSKGLNWNEAWLSAERVMKTKVKSNRCFFRLSCHSNDSINVAGIKSVLQIWEREGWVPDVLVIDYADILAPPAGHTDTRDQINTTWKQLRGLSQTNHCLVVTATQADAQSYGKTRLDKKNFSEDKRKLSHVTAMVGINVLPEEKEIDTSRLNWIVVREREFVTSKCVYVAGCLDLANPCVLSKM